MSVKWGGCCFTLLLIVTGLGSVRAEISDLRRCADPECKEPISKGRTMIGYPSNDEQILSFPINAEVTVYSKEAGSRNDLWGAEIKGKRGYVPKQYVREQKVFVSKLEYEVPTEGSSDNQGSASDTGKADDAEESHKESSTEPEGTEAQTEPRAEEIALSAEDVEYNLLRKAALDKPDRDPHKEGVAVVDVTANQGDAEEKELPDDVGEEEVVEEEEVEEEEEEADFEEDEGVVDEEPVEVAPDDTEVDNQEVQPSNEEEEGDKIEDNEGKDAVLDAETGTEAAEIPPTLDTPMDAEPSPANYEVIDGTTLYFDDTTPLPPTAEVLPPIKLMSSSVSDQDYITAHPTPILSHAAYEDSRDQNANIEVTSTLSAETISTVIMESESVVTEAPVEPTKTLPSETEVSANIDDQGAEKPIEPSSSWLSDATASVTSWFGSEDNETEEKETNEEIKDSEESPLSDDDDNEKSDGFGDPKAQSIVDGAEITGEEEQNDGFFSSWFASSEAPKDQDIQDESPENLGITESDEAVTEKAEGEPDRDFEASSTDASNADPVDTLVPSDTVSTPVEPTESPEIFAQPPYTSDDVDNAYSTQHSTLSSVDAIPETPATPDLDYNPENPLDLGDTVYVQDPSLDLSTAALNDQVELTDNTDDDEDPGTSTARPMYAVPDPASQDYRSNNNVDPDDLSHLAGEGAVMDGAESSEGDEADISLSEGLLKTSHNLWLTLTGALKLPEGLAFGFEAELAEPHVSNGMFVFLLIVSGTVVTIYFVHLLMLKFSREAPLLEALNRIDHENRVKGNENDSLQAELAKARTELEGVASRVTTSSGDVDEISSQLELVKSEYASEKNQLEERVVQLEHELEEATSNGIEMHKMLSEMLSSQKDASAFQASVDHLQAMLDGQREKVETLTSDLALKNRLNEELHSELSASMERASKLDYQVEQLTHSLEELTGVKGEEIRRLQEEASVVEELKQVNVSLTQQTGEYDSQVTSLNYELTDLRDTINQLRESVETKESELQVAKECLKQLRLSSSDDSAAPDEEKLSALFDVIRVKAELHKVSNERLTLVEQLQDAEMAQKNLEDTMGSIRTEVAELRTHHDLAIREKQEAMSKLEVLTKYFEEKEAQLTKELESQEGLRVNAEGSAAAVGRKIRNYDMELATYKTQVESLRKELEEQESSYKTQISSHEQKAHDNWLQARAAERKHEEQRQENSQLRSRLTIMQKEKEDVQQSQVNIIKPTPKRVDANGTMSSPRPMVDGIEGDHSGPLSLHRDLDSPPIPHPMHGPPMLSMMFPPGGPLPPGVPPPHGLPHGVPPPHGLPHGVPPGLPHGVPPGLPHGVPPGLPHGVPPGLPHGVPHGLPHGVPPGLPHGVPPGLPHGVPPGLPHGVPPPHGLPPHPFLPGEPPFMGPLPPLPGDRRLPPAGGMSSPPFRRAGSPTYDHRNDRYSPLSDRSHISDRRYSPPPLRRRPLSPDMHRNRSPDRRSDRPRSPDRRSDRMMRSPDHRNDRRSPDRRLDRRSPDRHYNRSPDGYMRHRNSPRSYYDEPEFNSDESRLRSHLKVAGKKTSTPLGPNDR